MSSAFAWMTLKLRDSTPIIQTWRVSTTAVNTKKRRPPLARHSPRHRSSSFGLSCYFVQSQLRLILHPTPVAMKGVSSQETSSPGTGKTLEHSPATGGRN